MVHSEDTPPQRKPSISTPVKPEYRLSPTEAPSVYEIQTPAYDSRREIRPPQPSPLQTQGQHDLHLRNGAAYTAVQSPYQQTPPPSFSGGHVPPTQILNQSPSHGYHTPQHSQRESYPGSGHPNGRSFGHSTPLSQTPTTSTPGSASGYANFQRPSSSHSTTTSISAQQSSNFVGESPQPTHHQLRTSSQAQIGQQFMSQPSTPLGPPLTHARPSLNIHRGSPESYDHRRTHSGSSYGQPQATTPSSSTARSPQNNRVQQSRSSGPDHTSPREREGSESVSPKTRLPSLPRVGSMDTSSDQAHRDYGLATPVKRKVEWETSGSQNAPFQVNRAPSLPTSVGMNGLLNTEPPTKSTQRVFREQMTQSPLRSDSESEAKVSGETPLSLTKPMYQPHLDRNVAPVPLCSISTHNSVRTNTPLHQPPQPSMPPGTTAKPFPQRSDVVNSLTRSETNTFHGSSIGLQSQPTNDMARSPIGANNEARQYIKTECSKDGKSTSSQPARKKPRLEPPASEQIPPAKQKLDAEIPLSSSASTLKPRNKTPCAPRIANFRDVPVYARSVRGRERTEELFLLSQRRAATGQNAPPIRHLPKDSPPHRSAQANGNQSANGHTASANNTPVPVAQAIPADLGPLGFWEKSISGIEPMEELTRIVGDFLYESVVLKTDIGVGPAGGAANLGAVFEIEAKIGQLIDLKTNDRLRLPVLNECVINHASSDLRVKFQSSMTEVCLLHASSHTPLLIIVPSLGPASCLQRVLE